MINLFISLYPIDNQLRINEIETALFRNISNPYINKITILNEGLVTQISGNKKVKTIIQDERPMFSEFYKFLEIDKINVIANNDIYFDDTLKHLKSLQIKKGDFLALTRRESNGELFRAEIGDSQDVWIFYGKPKVLLSCDFYLGVPGCDNLIAYKFHEAGYRVLNPSKVINCWHLHASQERNYTEENRVKGKYLYIRPMNKLATYINRVLQLVAIKIQSIIFNYYQTQ